MSPTDDESGEREPPADVPDDAEPFIDPDGPTPGYALFGNLWVTDDAIYSTGVTCRRCRAGAARIDRDTGETTCPRCGWPDEDRRDPPPTGP